MLLVCFTPSYLGIVEGLTSYLRANIYVRSRIPAGNMLTEYFFSAALLIILECLRRILSLTISQKTLLSENEFKTLLRLKVSIIYKVAGSNRFTENTKGW
jgi:hypothetical protein